MNSDFDFEEDDFKDLCMPVCNLSDSTVRWWSQHARDKKFGDEKSAREWIYNMGEYADSQPSAIATGAVDGPEKNKARADEMPLYQENGNGVWRIGRPLSYWKQEKQQAAYQRRKAWNVKQASLKKAEHDRWVKDMGVRREDVRESFHSDFSDGTNGEPSAASPYTSGTGTVTGVPDYKYFERNKAKHDKLKSLLSRPDPKHTSRVAWDRNAQAGLKEDAQLIVRRMLET